MTRKTKAVDVLITEQEGSRPWLVDVYATGENNPFVWYKDVHRSHGIATHDPQRIVDRIRQRRAVVNVWHRDLDREVHVIEGLPWRQAMKSKEQP